MRVKSGLYARLLFGFASLTGLAQMAVAQSVSQTNTVSSSAAKPAVTANAIEASPSWKALTPAQQAALKPMQAEWGTLDANRKKKWLVVAQRYQTLSSAEQARMHERMGQWAKLSPEQRSVARDNYSAVLSSPNASAAGVDSSPKNNLNEQWAKYQALPADKKASLAEQAAKPAETGKAKPLSQ